MAIAKIKKVQIIANKQSKSKILHLLQGKGSTQIINTQDEEINKYTPELQKIELEHANIQFAIKLLSKYEEKKGFFGESIELTTEEVEEAAKQCKHKEIAKECLEIEDQITTKENDISMLENSIKQFSPWKALPFNIEDVQETKTSSITVGKIKTAQYFNFKNDLFKLSELIDLQTIKEDGQETLFTVIFSKELSVEVSPLLSRYKYTPVDLPKAEGSIKDYIEELTKTVKELKKEIAKAQKDLKVLSKNLRSLKIAYDYLGWELEKLQEAGKSENTEYNFLITAWVVAKDLKEIEEDLEKITKETLITEIQPNKGEEIPVTLQNNRHMAPFEAVTMIFGLPKSTELDPTPYLSAFFIIYFGLCLTDAGYGIIMFVVMALVLKFVNLPSSTRKLVKLLMYGGVATFFIGAYFGGWFGLTADQVPAALTYTAESGEQMFLFQKVNALTDPLTVLILAAALGFIQVTVGTFMKFFHEFFTVDKKEAVLETAPWCYLLSALGFFVLTSAGVLSASLAPLAGSLALGGIYLIIAIAAIRSFLASFTKAKAGIVGKFFQAILKGFIPGVFKGALTLYGLVGYVSDILSYSRLLALGLATAIIALSVNIIAVLLMDMIPYVGWIFMIIVLIGGHIFNLLINALGAYIHSGRLQFVEFFGKFMEGGGLEFQPFNKKSKYVFIKK